MIKKNDLFDKKKQFDFYVSDMLNRIQSMYTIEGLPDDIPPDYVRKTLFTHGECIGARYSDKLYIFECQRTGKLDAYYNPVEFIVTNPWINLSKTFERGKDCIWIKNDSNCSGVMGIINKYAQAMVENDISLLVNDILARAPFIMSATDNNTRQSAEQFLSKIFDGDYAVISTNEFLKGLTVSEPKQSQGRIKELIEYEQYIKASWLNALGIDAIYNMKRESLATGETTIGHSFLHPLVDDIITNVRKGFDDFNKMFGTNVQIDYNSSWADVNEEETPDESEVKENESNTDNDTDSVDG